MTRSCILLSLCLSPLCALTGPLNGLDEYVARAMKTFDVPGVAVAVVQNGEVALFSERQGREMLSPQAILPTSDPPQAMAALHTVFAAYGLGWVLREDRGHKMAGHTGGLRWLRIASHIDSGYQAGGGRAD
jgi:hypothetical protein